MTTIASPKTIMQPCGSHFVQVGPIHVCDPATCGSTIYEHCHDCGLVYNTMTAMLLAPIASEDHQYAHALLNNCSTCRHRTGHLHPQEVQ